MAYVGRQRWWQGVRFEFAPQALASSEHEIFVGVGDAQDAAHAGIVLNHKFRGSTFSSVSDYVRGADAVTVARWRDRFGAGWHQFNRVVLEDLSLDTCFALLSFEVLMRDGTRSSHEALPRRWAEYVARWEQGWIDETQAERSLAMLLSSLAHSHFRLITEAVEPATIDAEAFAVGAHEVLDLLTDAIAATDDPREFDPARLAMSPALARAQVHLGYELDTYRRALQRGITCQLALPIRASGRRLLVDCLFIEEATPSALVKAFARMDRASSTTGRGFELLGLYRPALRGTGDDMVLSVSKESGLSLETLWRKLEELEDQRWAGHRPSDRPRFLRSYAGKDDAPNQPWWDDGGQHTLLAAPRTVEVGGVQELGSRLGWYEDVMPALWSCYSPLPSGLNLAVEKPQNFAGEKVWRECHWQHGHESDEIAVALVASPTFTAWLKWLSRPGSDASTTPASMLELPSPQSCERIDFPGGAVVLDVNGMTVFDDWTPIKAPADLKPAYEALVSYWNSLHALPDLRGGLLSFQKEWLDNRQRGIDHYKFNRKSFEEWQVQCLTARTELSTASTLFKMQLYPWPVNHIMHRLSELLDLEGLGHEADRVLDQVERATTDVGEHLREKQSERFHAVAAGLGLGFASKEAVELVKQAFTSNLYEIAATAMKDPHDARAVEEAAKQLEYWERSAPAVAVVFGVFGYWLYRKFGERLFGE